MAFQLTCVRPMIIVHTLKNQPLIGVPRAKQIVKPAYIGITAGEG